MPRLVGDRPSRAELGSLVLACVEEALAERERVPDGDLGESTSLIGQTAVLDSLGLVTVVVELEQRLDEEYGLPVTVADERAMSQQRSPFRTVGALADYVYSLVETGGFAADDRRAARGAAGVRHEARLTSFAAGASAWVRLTVEAFPA
jgi:acyl carrier protein